jgi:hypothetical protein
MTFIELPSRRLGGIALSMRPVGPQPDSRQASTFSLDIGLFYIIEPAPYAIEPVSSQKAPETRDSSLF